MLILDLAAEYAPQYQRFDSFYGQPFIWCMIHNYGGRMGLYGHINSINQVRQPRLIVLTKQHDIYKAELSEFSMSIINIVTAFQIDVFSAPLVDFTMQELRRLFLRFLHNSCMYLVKWMTISHHTKC